MYKRTVIAHGEKGEKMPISKELIEVSKLPWFPNVMKELGYEPIRHGRWIFNPKDAIEMMFTLLKCSECGAESPDGGNYCHNCGAKMDGEREDAID